MLESMEKSREEIERYREVSTVLETTQSELEELESSEALLKHCLMRMKPED